MSAARSLSLVVRNPLMALPAANELRNLSPEARAAVHSLMKQISADATASAQRSAGARTKHPWRRTGRPSLSTRTIPLDSSGQSRRFAW
jgi:hypothetical protein